MKVSLRTFFAVLTILLSSSYASLTLAQNTKDPSLNEIYQAAKNGNISEAETMVSQVLINHPDSAKAHYVAAEVYAKAAKLDDARLQLAMAEKLNPGLNFVKPDSVDRLKNQLGVTAKDSGSSQRAPSWMGWILGFALLFLVIAVVRKLMAPRPQPMYQPANGAGSYAPNPYGSGYPPPASGGMGSSILGGLATGAAVGAGIVAGEALMRNILDDEQAKTSDTHNNDLAASDHHNDTLINRDMGGDNFGISDSNSWDDSGSSFGDSGSDFTDNSSDWS